ncbi:MAG: GTP-binding protein [Candidatus Heimdallarchaeota archaeon]|nr:GTP-binding protein [Candidatus Heimdallarchaeota archaeon]MBY8994745.1 GTP-binding protein [Candidatus Heimdallarchaeota archaeon]
MAFFLRLFRKKKQANMTICGLDKAGKTSVINYLMYGENRATIPTMGVNVNTVNLPKLDINIYDLGGQEGFRPLWADINERSQAIVYIVDSTDYDRFALLTRSIFHDIINAQIEEDIPVLVLLNKIDLPNRMSRADFIYHFGLLELTKITWSCFETSAMTGEGLVEAFTNFIHKLEDEA